MWHGVRIVYVNECVCFCIYQYIYLIGTTKYNKILTSEYYKWESIQDEIEPNVNQQVTEETRDVKKKWNFIYECACLCASYADMFITLCLWHKIFIFTSSIGSLFL